VSLKNILICADQLFYWQSNYRHISILRHSTLGRDTTAAIKHVTLRILLVEQWTHHFGFKSKNISKFNAANVNRRESCKSGIFVLFICALIYG